MKISSLSKIKITNRPFSYQFAALNFVWIFVSLLFVDVKRKLKKKFPLKTFLFVNRCIFLFFFKVNIYQ